MGAVPPLHAVMLSLYFAVRYCSIDPADLIIADFIIAERKFLQIVKVHDDAGVLDLIPAHIQVLQLRQSRQGVNVFHIIAVKPQ